MSDCHDMSISILSAASRSIWTLRQSVEDPKKTIQDNNRTDNHLARMPKYWNSSESRDALSHWWTEGFWGYLGAEKSHKGIQTSGQSIIFNLKNHAVTGITLYYINNLFNGGMSKSWEFSRYIYWNQQSAHFYISFGGSHFAYIPPHWLRGSVQFRHQLYIYI